MQTRLQVLSEEERAKVHAATLEILAKTGVRVATAKGREILAAAGALVDGASQVVRFPTSMVETSLRLAPNEFILGARRPGWDLAMNSGSCSLMMSGQGTQTLDRHTDAYRLATARDLLEATRLADSLDEIGVYWGIVEASDRGDSIGDFVEQMVSVCSNFSKHIQMATKHVEQAPWLLEILQVVFGDLETIRGRHPLSIVLCPQSPLAIDEQFTDAYLALAGHNIPVGVVPMALMGATAPASLVMFSPHNYNSMTVGLSAICNLAAGIPNLAPIEYFPELAEKLDGLCTGRMVPKDGRLALPEGPGFGLTFDDSKMASYAWSR